MFPIEIELVFENSKYNITYSREVISSNEIQFLVDVVKTDLGENLHFWVLHYYPLKEKNKTEMEIFKNTKLNELKLKIADAIIARNQAEG